MSAFNSPFLLGFDRVERVLERVAKSAGDGYPPYNIEQIGDDCLRITLAVAGFKETDLSVTVEQNQLVIRGRHRDEVPRVFIHRGIAARQFQRSFILAEGIEIAKATLDSGLLHIDLERPKPSTVARTIEIAKADGARASHGQGIAVTNGEED
jgi:HSP20 family molecular chaperone IbpA